MATDRLKKFYEDTSERFWDPAEGLRGRDVVVYDMLKGCSGTILEYGCGAGSLILEAAKDSRFTKAYGIDISERALAGVRQAWDSIGSKDADKLQLLAPKDDLLPSISDKSIDVIISVATIEHVLDPYVVLDELHRIATDDAVFVVCVPNLAYVKLSVGLFFGQQPKTGTDDPVENWRRTGWDGMHLHTFTKSSFTILLRDCGWMPQEWTGWGWRYNWLGIGPLRKRFPGFWSGELIARCSKGPRPANAGSNERHYGS